MPRFALLLAALSLSIGPAQAISRYDISGITCEAARDIVAREGAVILRYPSQRQPSLTLYDRFVAHGGFCSFSEFAGATTIPTASGACTLLSCKQVNDLKEFGIRSRD